MTLSRREWKREARCALKGNYMIAIGGMILTTIVSTVASNLTNLLFPGEGTFTFILAEVFAFIISLVMNVLLAGYTYMLLKIARRQQPEMGDLLYFFRTGPDRVIVAGFVMTLIQLLTSLPGMIYSGTVPVGEGDTAFVQWQAGLLKWLLIGILLQSILSLAFTFVYHILADNPDMEGFAALRVSANMMRGHYWRYILLGLSFVPIIVGSVFTLYISLLWIIPYMKVTTAIMYRDLSGEYLNQYMHYSDSSFRLESEQGIEELNISYSDHDAEA